MMGSNSSSDEFSTDTEAVFTSAAFDHPAHDKSPVDEENFNEQYPLGGRYFARALQDEFTHLGVAGPTPDKSDEEDTAWEHGAWLLWLEDAGRTYTVRLWPMPTETRLWWLSFSENRGCLLTLFGPRKPYQMPRSLQHKVQAIVERIAKTKDFRWTTEEEAMKMF
jgi:hypothetical protein